MSKLVDIKTDKFWEVLFDEACVEGSQADRIENELSKISVSEQEIRNKAIDETVKRFKDWMLENDGLSEKDIRDIDEIAEQMKGGE